jgi:hypothetical protein
VFRRTPAAAVRRPVGSGFQSKRTLGAWGNIGGTHKILGISNLGNLLAAPRDTEPPVRPLRGTARPPSRGRPSRWGGEIGRPAATAGGRESGHGTSKRGLGAEPEEAIPGPGLSDPHSDPERRNWAPAPSSCLGDAQGSRGPRGRRGPVVRGEMSRPRGRARGLPSKDAAPGPRSDPRAGAEGIPTRPPLAVSSRRRLRPA